MHRSAELDFARGVTVVLMVAGHVAYVGHAADALEGVRAVLGAFRMPALFLLSGYLSVPGPGSPPGSFAKLSRRLLVPYLAFEAGYLLLLHVAWQAGVANNNHVPAIGPAFLAWRLALEPFGVYWFLHNLVLCRAACIAALRLEARAARLGAEITLAVALVALVALVCLWGSDGDSGLRPSSAACFYAGFACRRLGLAFRGDRRWPLLALAALVAIGPETVKGHVALHPLTAWVFVASLVAVGRSMAGSLLERAAVWCGRNALLILVMHALILGLLRRLPPAVAALEPSGVLHTLLMVTLAVAGSVATGRVLDRLGLSGPLFGVARIYAPLPPAQPAAPSTEPEGRPARR